MRAAPGRGGSARRRVRALLRRVLPIALLWLASVAPAAVRAQTTRGAEIRLSTPSARAKEGPLVRIVNVLDDPELRDLLDHGFPLRVHYRAELWSQGGWLNDLRGSVEWDVVIRQDAMAKAYDVARVVGRQVTVLGRFFSVAEAIGAAERPFRVPLVPRRGQRSYYNVVITVETLSLSDLDEVDRWLRGELGPAVRRPGTAGTAIGRGLKTLAARMLGGETRQYEVRSETFRP